MTKTPNELREECAALAAAGSTILDFKAMFDAYHKKNEKVWDHDRKATMGASEAFACLRMTWFKKFGVDNGFEQNVVEDESWGAMERGNIMEEHWVVPAIEHGMPDKVGFEYGSEGQTTIVVEQNSATPDGLFTGLTRDALKLYGIDDIESDCVVVEIKSIDPRANLTEEKDIHHGQTQIQLGCIRALGEHQPVYGIILYVNASFYDDITPFVVRYDPQIFKAARNRAKKLFSAENVEQLPAEGKLSDACKLCDWTHACAKVSKEMVPEAQKFDHIAEEELHALGELARREKEIGKLIKELTEEKDEVRANIKQALADNDTRKAQGEGFKISWVWQGGSTTYNTKQAIADGVDLEAYKKEGDGFEKLTITLTE